MIQSVSAFIEYFDGVRRRTNNFIRAVPADRIDWSPKEGEWTCGEIVRHLEHCHSEAMAALRGLSDADLYQPRPTLNGPPVKAWRLLMAMVEHEVHHRSQLAVYLALMGVEPPQIYGLGLEDVIALSASKGK